MLRNSNNRVSDGTHGARAPAPIQRQIFNKNHFIQTRNTYNFSNFGQSIQSIIIPTPAAFSVSKYRKQTNKTAF